MVAILTPVWHFAKNIIKKKLLSLQCSIFAMLGWQGGDFMTDFIVAF